MAYGGFGNSEVEYLESEQIGREIKTTVEKEKVKETTENVPTVSKTKDMANDAFWNNLQRISIVLGLITSLFVIFQYVKKR